MHLRRAGTFWSDDAALATFSYNDKYVVVYEFGAVDAKTAVCELSKLIKDLHSAGLNTEVRKGHEHLLLVFVQVPRKYLESAVYQSRIKDWLYGITKSHPGGTAASASDASHEAEDLLAVHHLVHWPKELGGAGITPRHGQWANVSAAFPLHNHVSNRDLLAHLSTRILLTDEDLDKIRDLLGAKIAFYFAFLQTYFRFLVFPCVAGIFAWAFLPKYSLLFALIIGVWSTVFLEYWKIKQTDLAIRWNVRGIHSLKINRSQFRFETQTIDEAGRIRHHFPTWKRILRQSVAIPFVLISTLLLGALISTLFVIETFISEAYVGPYRFYLEYLPTALLAVFLPYATSMLETIATTMTEYENHRAADHHEESLAQKVFILNSITNYLPLLLTAFIYVPFGDCIIPVLQQSVDAHLGREIRTQTRFLADPDRLRNEVIAFTLTGQIANAFEELVYPWLKAQAKQWWRDRQAKQNDHDDHTEDHTKLDGPSRATFLRRARDQATRPAYNVQDDIAEMVIQFGYLALFSPVWPLVPVGLFINNWIELRSDFLKICVDHQRPAPIRSDGIGPWVASLESLTWLGSISSAAIVHLFGSHRYLADFCDLGTWASLPITILLSEHMFMGFRAAIRFALSHMGSEQTRKEHAERYAERKKFSDELEAHRKTEGHIGTTGKKRHHRVMINEADISGVAQFEDSASEQACIDIIKAAKSAEETRVTGRWKFK